MIFSVFACAECGAATLRAGTLPHIGEFDGISRTPDMGICGIVRYSVERQSQHLCRGQIVFKGYTVLMNTDMEQELVPR
jgi:hypothetical protein